MSRKAEPTKQARLRISTVDKLEAFRTFESQTIDELVNLLYDGYMRYKNSYVRKTKNV